MNNSPNLGESVDPCIKLNKQAVLAVPMLQTF